MDANGMSPTAKAPRTRVCYICGRQYGLHSFDIHLKQCKELWIAREAQKDPRERKPLPPDPMEGRGMSPSPTSAGSPMGAKSPGSHITDEELEAMNKAAGDAFKTVSLATCQWCGRTFLPEKLVIHNRSCTQDNPARKVAENVRKSAPLPEVSRPHTSGGRPKSVHFDESATPPTDKPPARPQSSAMRNAGRNNTNNAPSGPVIEEISNLASTSPASLAGHLGGTSGRSLRNGTVESPTPKAQIVKELAAKIEEMEKTSVFLAKSIRDMKVMLADLQNM